MGLIEFWERVFHIIGLALRLNPEAFTVLRASSHPNLVLFAIVVLCGASLLLGQSVILFLNRVPPPRFVLSLLLNGVLFGVGLLIWGLIIFLIASGMFGLRPVRGTLLWVICLSSAPFILGFLVLIPWAGIFIGRVLSAWSLLIALLGVQQIYRISFWAALLCVALGWLAMQLAQATVGKPIVALRDWLWRKVVGNPQYRHASDILEAFLSDEPLPETLRRERPWS
jgi:hypothetical protein